MPWMILAQSWVSRTDTADGTRTRWRRGLDGDSRDRLHGGSDSAEFRDRLHGGRIGLLVLANPGKNKKTLIFARQSDDGL